MRMILVFVALAAAFAVNLINGAAGGMGALVGMGRPGTWLLTLILLFVMLILIGLILKESWDGIFIDQRNKISLSRMQLVFWTVLIVASLLTAALSNVILGADAPLEIKIPEAVWALLGLGSFTFVASNSILAQKQRQVGATTTTVSEANARKVATAGTAPSAPKTAAEATIERLSVIDANLKASDGLTQDLRAVGSVIFKGSPMDARWMDIFRGDEADSDYVDMSKVQQFSFTALLLFIYAASVFKALAAPGPLTALPAIDGGFVALLGLSHAAYLGYKVAPK